MGVGQKKNARNSPIGRVTKGDHLLWSDLYYILLQNRHRKVKLFSTRRSRLGLPGGLLKEEKGLQGAENTLTALLLLGTL